MKRRRSIKIPWTKDLASALVWITCLMQFGVLVKADGCPPSEAILPCRCSLRDKDIQIWCSHSNLPQIIDGLKAVERNTKSQIDELVLENNQLPALPGRFFGNLQIARLMLRYNSIERVSNGWLNELENSLVEIYIVEPQLRSIPVESLNGMINMVAITIQSEELKHLPDFSGLLSLTYLSVQSASLAELQPHTFRHLPKLQHIQITGASSLNRLEVGLFDGLISLKNIDLSRNGINWIHLRSLTRLPNLVGLKLSYNQISDVAMIGRIIKDLEHLKRLRLDHNIINVVEDGSFVDLPYLAELHLNDNRITEIEYGAFLRTPMLKTIYLHNNHIKRIHPESFLQASGSGVETVYMYNNEISHIDELRSLLDALPTLRFLEMSNNYLTDIPYGSLRGHGTLEQLHLNNNQLRTIERDALMAMPALRELRMRNNSLSSQLPLPFWNLPGLKGLDLALNEFHTVDSQLLAGLPSLRRLDLSANGLTLLEPTAFNNNPLLETLNISYNALIKMHPATLRRLDRLFEVDASVNQFVDIIPGLPRIVERISMRGNRIATLPNTATKLMHLPNLRMLDLSQNRLEHLPKYGFQGVPQIRVLSLAHNRLRMLDDTAFVGAQRLELLHLQENQLSQIDERTFLPLYELRNLNLQSNKLEGITDNLFSNNSRLEQLNLSHNQIRTIAPAAFEIQRALEYLDLSGNALTDISVGLANLQNMRDIDLSYNQLSRVHADIVSAWRNVVEIRLSNNLIVELKHGTFRNLPKLQYLDLSSNEVSNVEPGSLKQLPDLQEFVLADNKLVELKDHVFEDLPNLLASHFQYNNLRYISSDSFFNSPSMVFLNLSNNHFRNMENIGLRSMRNLEVLDLSSNGVKMVTTMPLKALSWLVELKMDNNQICKIQGAPFETMPRLRVLSMRNNQLRTIKERTFRNLRGNIAILDVDGNPIDCSCEMQWLSVWLQETNFPYPGPKCQDGRLLRASRMDRSLCSGILDDNNEHSGHFADDSNNHLPLLNEHGDVFQRELPADYNDDCDAYEPAAQGERPMPGDSEYFYDQYVDYAPANDTTDAPESTNAVLSTPKRPRPSVSSNIDLNNTILNTKYFNKRPHAGASHNNSPFTFFGYPIPGLSLGRFFGFGDRGRKQRGEETSDVSISSAQMPATHRMGQVTPPTTRGKVRMYQPNSAEFEKYLRSTVEGEHQRQQLDDSTEATARNRYIDSASLASDEAMSNEQTSPPVGVFRTAFREPASIERGGFRPIVPPHISGFIPVHDPRRGIVEVVSSTKDPATAKTTATSPSMLHKRANKQRVNVERNFIPIAVEQGKSAKDKSNESKIQPRLPTPTSSEELELQTYYVTETTQEETPTPVPALKTTTKTLPSHLSTSSTQGTTASVPTTTVTSFTQEEDLYEDLEAEAVSLLKPPPLVQTTTAETILLIPPAEEHVAQIKSHSWVTTSTSASATTNADDDNLVATTSPPYTTRTTRTPLPGLRSPGGRSTITKVQTPHSHNQYLPTAEEYQRTTPSADNLSAASNQYLTANAQKRTEVDISQVEHIDRKDGMDWYYESFKKKRDFNGLTASNETESKPTTNKKQAERNLSNRSKGNPYHFSGISTILYFAVISPLLR